MMNSVSETHSKLKNTLSHLAEDSIYDDFKSYYKKVSDVHNLASSFYIQTDKLLLATNLSSNQIKKLQESYKSITGRYREFDLNNRFNKIKFKEHVYPFSEQSLELSKVFVLILKNDMILNEIEVLMSIHNDQYQEGHYFSQNFVICEEIDKSNKGEYGLKVLMAESKRENQISKLRVESLTCNGVLIPKSLVEVNSLNEVHFKSLSPGNYELLGEYLLRGPTGYKVYPVKHRFTIDK